MKILSVLKSHKTNTFDFSHVLNLKKMCDKYLPGLDFYCLSDMNHPDLNIIPLTDNLPKAWSKMELYKINGPCLYFDLDIIIKKPINLNRLKKFEFLFARDSFCSVEFNTSIVYWRDNMSFLYTEFLKKKNSWSFDIGRYDQTFVTHVIKEQRDKYGKIKNMPYFQQVYSIGDYKADIHRQTWGPLHGKNNRIPQLPDNINKKPEDYEIILFHGHPRPWEQDPFFEQVGVHYIPYWL